MFFWPSVPNYGLDPLPVELYKESVYSELINQKTMRAKNNEEIGN
jgi:hypothetical protein